MSKELKDKLERLKNDSWWKMLSLLSGDLNSIRYNHDMVRILIEQDCRVIDELKSEYMKRFLDE